VLWLSIDRNKNIPLIRQIYEQIRLQIIQGEMYQGEKLPSTRELAETLKVSRNVVLEAYDQLSAEGYMTSLMGSGSYVADGACLKQFRLEQPRQAEPVYFLPTQPQNLIDFQFGVPALDLFPGKKWGQIYRSVCNSSPVSIFGYGEPEGREELRQVLAHYLTRNRGVYCEPDQIIITTGAMQAIFIIANVLLSSKDTIVSEDPLNRNIRQIFTDTGAKILPIPVDEQGIQTNLVQSTKDLRLIYITPSHQFPLGSTLPIQRRIELVETARKTGCYILEDNYDNEFRFEGTPVSSLQGLEPELVFYVGTFSKILSPALRIGYMVVPRKLINSCRRYKDLLDHHSPSLNQLVLTQFIEQGYFERHIAKMKKVYRKRQETIIKSLTELFPGEYKVSGHSTGLHLIVEFDHIEFNDEVNKRLKEAGIVVYPVEMYAINKGRFKNRIMLGYGNVNEEQIVEGMKRMKECLDIIRTSYSR